MWHAVPPHCDPDLAGDTRRGNMGAKAVMERLGVIPRGDQAPAPPQGLKRARGGDGRSTTLQPSQAFAEFRRACREAQGTWEQVQAETSIANIGAVVEAIVTGLGRSRGLVPAWSGYVKNGLVCKLILACPFAGRAADWHTVTRAELQRWSPDEAGVLKAFPEGTTAS